MARAEAYMLEEGILGEFPYAIWENGLGFLCGYIGVPPGHPWYGQDMDDVECDVHGGVTYTQGNIHGLHEAINLLHAKINENNIIDFYEQRLAEEKELAGLYSNYPIDGARYDCWWLGFDCGHYMDAARPGSYMDGMFNYGTYRDRDYVFKEIEDMVQQAISAAVKQEDLKC